MGLSDRSDSLFPNTTSRWLSEEGAPPNGLLEYLNFFSYTCLGWFKIGVFLRLSIQIDSVC